jgi:DHA2 family multidrug resistance protein
MFASGLFLLIATAIRHFLQPNPLINFRFLGQGNTLLLGVILVFFRFALLATVVLVPAYLSSAQGYLAEQIGPVLLWLAVPQFLTGLLAVALLGRLDSRLILASGFALIASACIANAQLTSAWSGSSFLMTQLVLALGEALAFGGVVGTIVLEALNSGALERGIDILTFAGFFQTVRLFGGEVGASFIQFFLQRREEFHSNILGLSVQRGAYDTTQRAAMLTAGMIPQSSGLDVATGRAATLLGLTIRKQAFTLAVADSFRIIATAAILCLLVIACMSPHKLQYKQVTGPAQSPPK